MTAEVTRFGRPAEPSARDELLERLWWLFDAPMFIDCALVGRLHDILAADEDSTPANGEAEPAPDGVDNRVAGEGAGVLSRLVSGGAAAARDSTADPVGGRGEDRKLRRIVTEYLRNYPERLLFMDAPGGQCRNFDGAVSEAELSRFARTPPRPLIFLDKHPEALLFPIEAELRQSEYRSEFKRLDAMPLSGLNQTPDYPGDHGARERLREYWASIELRIRSYTARRALQTVCGEGRIAWIDYRLLLRPYSRAARLHVAPDPGFPCGRLSGDFLQRANDYGCRIIGTLKSGANIDVLAIYEL